MSCISCRLAAFGVCSNWLQVENLSMIPKYPRVSRITVFIVILKASNDEHNRQEQDDLEPTIVPNWQPETIRAKIEPNVAKVGISSVKTAFDILVILSLQHAAGKRLWPPETKSTAQMMSTLTFYPRKYVEVDQDAR